MADSTWWVKAKLSGEGPVPVQKAPQSLGIPFVVMTGGPTALVRRRFAAASLASLCLGACLGLAAPRIAHAGPIDSLREGLFGKRHDGREIAAPPIAHFVTEDGDGFILDRTGPKPLLRFDGSFEVWALQASPAPRGDTIYKNDLGEPMLRATRLGGLTVFTDQRPGGSAAALLGVAPPLRLAIMGPAALLERLELAHLRTSRAIGRLIPFEAEADPASSALIADAAMVTSEALVRMAKRSDGRKLLDRVQRVHLLGGQKASAQLAQGVLEITVAPPQGFPGRPSSDRIVQVTQAFR